MEIQNASEIEQGVNEHALHDHFAPAQQMILDWNRAVQPHHTHFFTTDVNPEELFNAYLSGFKTEAGRQYHNCSCCRSFFKRFAHLVVIDPTDFKTKSAIFPPNMDGIHPEFAEGLTRVRQIVEGARIKRVFYSYGNTHGIATTRGRGLAEAGTPAWDHFYAHLNVGAGRNRVKTPGQNAAEIAEDYAMFRRGLGPIPVTLLDQALKIFKLDETLQYYLPQVSTLTKAIEVKERCYKTDDRRVQENIHWLAVASNSKGLSRIGTGGNVLANYLTTLAEGKAAEAKSNFLAQTDPKDYMRPKAAPTTANVRRAEEIVEKLGVKNSLRRRSLRRDEIKDFLWAAKEAVPENSGGVFGHLKTKDAPKPINASTTIVGGKITLGKFLEQIMPLAEKVMFSVPAIACKQYMSYTTAVDQEAPPIFRGDGRICGYSYTGGSQASNWGLRAGSTVKVDPHLRTITTSSFTLAETVHPPICSTRNPR